MEDPKSDRAAGRHRDDAPQTYRPEGQPPPQPPEGEADIAGEHQYAAVDEDLSAGGGSRETESPRGLAGMD
ncbi:MAG TPA: hypothetical protein VFY17_10145 [Pilimelia sp.]|nr:hypothetical protein [Pilimelia sp.]